MKNFEFYELENLIINRDYYQIFQKNGLLDIHSIKNLKNPFYEKKKRYRLIQAFQINGLKLFIKKYEKNLKEAESEWKNISLLWKKGFPTSIPVFFYKNSSIALIGTEAIPGKMCLEIIKENPEKTQEIIKKIAQFLGRFHKNKLFHQDCYLNHFYWDEEKIYILDVSRVKYNPCFGFYYLIKDLSQLKFSFLSYFGNLAEKYWKYYFIGAYKKENNNLYFFTNFFIKIKVFLIKKHTNRVLKKGGII